MISIRIDCGMLCRRLIPRQFQTVQWYRLIMRRARAACSVWTALNIAIVFVDRNKMREINKTYHGQDRVTDILSFAYPSDGYALNAEGELYLCPDQITRQALRYGSTRIAEYTRVIVHGILHLQGYDHMTVAERRRMNKLSSMIRSVLVNNRI